MNKRLILKILGIILCIEGAFLLLPLLGRCGELVSFFIHGVSSSVSSI